MRINVADVTERNAADALIALTNEAQNVADEIGEMQEQIARKYERLSALNMDCGLIIGRFPAVRS